MSTLPQDIRRQLSAAGDADASEKGKRFFKEEVTLYGAKNVEVKRITHSAIAAVRDMDKKKVFKLAEELWQSGMLEETWIACELSYSRREEFQPDDMAVFSVWLDKYVTNWATCDTLCNHSVGALVEMHPSVSATLRQWTKAKNRWKKRAAAVSLIIPARKGLFLDDVFHIADALLSDPDDLVQKGYGWALKAASEAHCRKVYDFVVARKATMPRTAYRYALEKMPKDMRAEAMKKQ